MYRFGILFLLLAFPLWGCCQPKTFCESNGYTSVCYAFKDDGRFKYTIRSTGRYFEQTGSYQMEKDALILTYDSVDNRRYTYEIQEIGENDTSLHLTICAFDTSRNEPFMDYHATLRYEKDDNIIGDQSIADGDIEFEVNWYNVPVELQITPIGHESLYITFDHPGEYLVNLWVDGYPFYGFLGKKQVFNVLVMNSDSLVFTAFEDANWTKTYLRKKH